MPDLNGTLETLGAGLVGLIPQVGAFASAVFTLLWPDTEVDYWELVKAEALAAIEEALNKAKVQELKELLEGTKKNWQEYVDTTNEDEKKTRAVALDVVYTQIKNRFMDESLDSVVYFVQFAVLHISINVDIALIYNDDKNRKSMKDLVDEYSAYGQKMLPKLAAFRLSKIDTSCRFDPLDPLVVRHNKVEKTGTYESLVTSYGVAQDHKTGKDLVFAAFMESRLHPYGGPVHTEIPGGKNRSMQQLAEYRSRVEQNTNEYWVQNLIDPIDIWRSSKVLNPVNAEEPERLSRRQLFERMTFPFTRKILD